MQASRGSIGHRKHRQGFGANPVSRWAKFKMAKDANQPKEERVIETKWVSSPQELFTKKKK